MSLFGIGESTYTGGKQECANPYCPAVFVPLVYEEPEGKGIHVQFACPECHRVYVVAYIDEYGLAIRKRLHAVEMDDNTLGAVTRQAGNMRRLRSQFHQHVTKGRRRHG